LKFRLLTAQALFNSNNIQACIKVLEKEPSPEEIANNNSGSQLNEQELSGLSMPQLLKKTGQTSAF